jgi:hypothetical protein
MFEQRVLPVTEEIIFKWRLLVEDGRKAGYTFSQPDLIMAARRSIMAAPAVTRNLSDYERVRARVFNPWVDSLPASASSGCGGSLDSSNTTRIEGWDRGMMICTSKHASRYRVLGSDITHLDCL